MSAKIISVRSAVCFFALALALAGCTPAGPRALLNGKKYLDRGDTAEAVATLKTATTLLATNATAWNYYGVALQRAGQPDDAESAYRRALDIDRDQLEAHLNLGALFLEQNKADAAKTEFTAYTLRRPNDPTGWLKLAAAQLKLGEIVPAERGFSAVLALKQNEGEAYNGLGLARVQRGRPREAAQFFAAAIQAKPDYAPALLNLATVSQQYLHDNKTALENYRAYLALTPKPANWDAVNEMASGLEPAASPVTTAVSPAPTTTKTNPPATETKTQPKISVVAATHATTAAHPQTNKPVVSEANQTRPIHSVPAQTVQVSPEPKIVAKPSQPLVAEKPVEAALPEPPAKPGFWERVFGSAKPDTGKVVTPLPDGTNETPAPTVAAAPEKKPVVIIAPAPVEFPRYNYLSPRRPAAGDHRAASGAFTKARLAEQDEKWADALKFYRQAAELDSAWFEAHYNAGVIAHKLRNFSSALGSYEMALALQSDSVDARYNFALALKAAGYAPDAAEELKKILAANPTEVRAHLALANLSAQLLRDPATARRHYLKVLELDPTNPRATDIRFWLAANPGA
jgi:tetratricopeptide (TPR) repeat protein